MNFYSRLNQFIDDIEINLDGDLRPLLLAQKFKLNLGIIERIFPLLAGMNLAEYIRKRRLTLAGRDLAQSNLRVIDVAMKYGYDSAEAFSRAFEKFHGLKPSEVKSHVGSLKYCQKLFFVAPQQVQDVTYEIVNLPDLELSGVFVDTDNSTINHDAPQLFIDIEKKYPELPHPDYGAVEYCSGRYDELNYRYWVLWQKKFMNHQPFHIPASRWLKFRINSQDADEIQATSNWFFENFLPTCCYEIKTSSDLEYYHDDVTDLLIPIQ